MRIQAHHYTRRSPADADAIPTAAGLGAAATAAAGASADSGSLLVDGDAASVLKVTLLGVGSTEVGPDDLPGAEGQLSQLVVEDEADGVTAYLALAREAAPFRVHLQHEPVRLVVEVAAGA